MTEPTAKSGWWKGAIQLALVIGVIVAALVLSNALKPSRSGGRPVASTAQAPVVSVISPTPRNYEVEVRLTGVVEYRSKTDIAPEVSGRVVRVSSSFRSGGQVRKNELLFEIDSQQYELAVDQTLAQIAAAESDLLLLKTEAELAIREWKEVYPDREPPALAAKEPQIGAAKARLQSAIAARKSAELALERTRIRAPFDARILETQLDEGQILNPNQIVGALYALDSVEVAATLSADELAMLSPAVGRPVTMTPTTSQESALSGIVARVSATLDSRTRLASLYIAPDDSAALTIGQFMNIAVGGAQVADARQIPSTAITGRNQVWVVSDARLQSRNVTVLGTEKDHTIVANFDAGDGVAVLPPPSALEGLEVVIASGSGGKSGVEAIDARD